MVIIPVLSPTILYGDTWKHLIYNFKKEESYGVPCGCSDELSRGGELCKELCLFSSALKQSLVAKQLDNHRRLCGIEFLEA